MAKMNRQQRRALEKMAGKSATSTIDLMLNIPDHCKICEKKFTKTKEELPNWFVEVYKEDKKINLFCKNCWESK
jgi:hypothetical protein